MFLICNLDSHRVAYLQLYITDDQMATALRRQVTNTWVQGVVKPASPGTRIGSAAPGRPGLAAHDLPALTGRGLGSRTLSRIYRGTI
jgi:hypothetical protein